MSANISAQNVTRRLDRVPNDPLPITERDAQDPSWLARTLASVLREVSLLRGRWAPRRVDFEDRTFDAIGTKVRLHHALGGRVRWWVADGAGSVAAGLSKHSASDDNVLVLTSTVAGTVTIRVEEAG